MKPEIAIALSGGGYRAAMFHLGTLTYLHQLYDENSNSFLDMVNAISTISGGTITGLWYMLQYANDNVSEDSFKQLYEKLRDSQVIEQGLKRMHENSSDSFIKEMVQVYDKVFFNNACFSEILDKIDNGHIHHFSANGTDFSNGFAFRFQASRKIVNTDPKFNRGIIGNKEHRLSWDIAKKIKLSEILAVSSCFPAGFEPMFFPSDFEISKDKTLQDSLESIKEDIPLMDGGIVDNQGIEPILLANAQMQFDDERAKGIKDFPCHDLIIVSDVSHPKTESFKKDIIVSKNKVTLDNIDLFIDVSVVVCLALCVLFHFIGCSFLLGFFVCLVVLLAILRIVSLKLKSLIKRKLKNSPISINVKYLWKYPVSNYWVLMKNREKSFLQLSKAIFMKPIRQMRYKALYESRVWKNRRITNTIYELTKEYGSWKKKLDNGKIPAWLAPSEAMQEISGKATEMGTTLWFTQKERDKGIPEALLACGQFTICMNLLEYIERLKNDSQNTTEAHKELMGYENKLKEDWDKFKANPFWIVESFTK